MSRSVVSQFIDPLDTREIDDRIFQIIDHPFRYQSDLAGLITVPVGFYTDFASVPRFLPLIYSCLGDKAHEPAVIHDWLYYAAITTRQVADDVLLEAMEISGIDRVRRGLIYEGVHLFGWEAWNEHRKAGHPQDGKFSQSPDIKGEN